MREICYKCFRPKASCYCKYTAPVNCNVKFIFLMHPKEAKRQRTGTGRLASLCLPDSEIITGIDFTKNERLCALLRDPQYYPVLLYPGEDAHTASSPILKQNLSDRKLLVIIIDSTWFCSKKMLRYSTNVSSLPKFSFYGKYKSIFTFKHEPSEYCISTIESCYYLIKELQENYLAPKEADPEPLLTVFKRMIQFQLEKENERIESGLPGTHAYDMYYTKKKEIPDFIKES